MPDRARPYTRFAPWYDVVYSGLVDYEGDVRYLAEAFDRYADGDVARVLDAGCGTGAHATLLAQKGARVTGVDISAELVERARAKAKDAGVDDRTEFHEGDMSKDLPEGPFDAVVSLFGAFNYLVDDASAEKFLDLAHARLREGGVLAFEFWNPMGVDPQKGWMRFRNGPAVLYRLNESDFDADADVVTLRFEFLALDGDRVTDHFEEVHHLRTRTRAAIRRMLIAHGFEPLAFTDGAREGKSFRPAAHDEFRIMAIARRG